MAPKKNDPWLRPPDGSTMTHGSTSEVRVQTERFDLAIDGSGMLYCNGVLITELAEDLDVIPLAEAALDVGRHKLSTVL